MAATSTTKTPLLLHPREMKMPAIQGLRTPGVCEMGGASSGFLRQCHDGDGQPECGHSRRSRKLSAWGGASWGDHDVVVSCRGVRDST